MASKKVTAPLKGVAGNNCHVCLTCFQIFDAISEAEGHVAQVHGLHSFPGPGK